ncbi:hypothetical protein ACFC18_48455, partial [Streptomyces sp. NPDC056121]|uniref:hypothetical protein n=1 Tax=Streptomyces sp. NPDC056121 TaxID=3345718 RepID=UPI0035E3490A
MRARACRQALSAVETSAFCARSTPPSESSPYAVPWASGAQPSEFLGPAVRPGNRAGLKRADEFVGLIRLQPGGREDRVDPVPGVDRRRLAV